MHASTIHLYRVAGVHVHGLPPPPTRAQLDETKNHMVFSVQRCRPSLPLPSPFVTNTLDITVGHHCGGGGWGGPLGGTQPGGPALHAPPASQSPAPGGPMGRRGAKGMLFAEPAGTPGGGRCIAIAHGPAQKGTHGRPLALVDTACMAHGDRRGRPSLNETGTTAAGTHRLRRRPHPRLAHAVRLSTHITNWVSILNDHQERESARTMSGSLRYGCGRSRWKGRPPRI